LVANNLSGNQTGNTRATNWQHSTELRQGVRCSLPETASQFGIGAWMAGLSDSGRSSISNPSAESTLVEHQRILAAEKNPKRNLFYQLLW
jgi:hypothetical protein